MDSCELQYSCGQENRVAEPGGEQVGGGLGEREGTVKGGGGAGEVDQGGRRGDPAVCRHGICPIIYTAGFSG